MSGVNETTPRGEMKTLNYPPWLDDLILAEFFKECSQHKSEKNYFCIDCGESLCSYCVSEHHSGQNHRILQIRRSSHKEAVRLSDVSKLVDLKDIQIFVINSAKIVFINSRPQEKTSKRVAFSCKTCHRTLMDSNKYRSLQCKLEALADDKTVNLLPKSVVSSSTLSPLESNLNYNSDSLKPFPKIPKYPKSPTILNTRKTSKGKRKASVFSKDEREVFSKEYDFKLIQEYPSSVSPPHPKRRRTPRVACKHYPLSLLVNAAEKVFLRELQENEDNVVYNPQ